MLAEQVRPSVVEIVGTVSASGDTSYGTGFVLREPNLVVTNAHVVRGVENLRVQTWQGGALVSIEVLLIETDIDLAVLRVRGLDSRPLAVGEQALPAVGTAVIAVGHPRGYEFTVSEGIVSAVRKLDEAGPTMIQMTTPISPGSSGGPLLDLQGRVVGVCSLTLTEGQNINFAIPVGELPPVLDKALSIERALRVPESSTLPVEALVALVQKQRTKGDLESAARLAERALQNHPRHVPLLLEAAEIAFSRGGFVELGALLDRILAVAPGNGPALQIRAAMFAEQGNCPAAQREAEQALASAGLDARQRAEAHAVLAECLGYGSDPAAALRHIDQALAYAEIAKLPDYHVLRALLLLALGRAQEADDAAVTALTRSDWDPMVVAALRERGLPRLTEVVTFQRERGPAGESVVGVVRNRGPIAIEELAVTAEGKNREGLVVATGTANAVPKRLVPGATGSFRVELQGVLDAIATLEVRVVDFKEP